MIHAAVLVSAFVILWFLAFFCLLPVGLGSAIDPETGAPLSPQLGRKALFALGIAIALWLLFYAALLLHIIDA